MNYITTHHLRKNFFKTETNYSSSKTQTSNNTNAKMAPFQQKSQRQQQSERDLPTPNFKDSLNPHLLHHLNFGQQWNESNQNRKWGFSYKRKG